jgi:hypothetical protein
MGTEADYLIDQHFDRKHGEYGVDAPYDDEGLCPFLLCNIKGPHKHSVCPDCGAVRHGNFGCPTCRAYRS